MFFADPPAISSTQDANSQADTIEVVGTRAGQVQKIDRRTYTVKDTPHAAQQDSVELLRGLPAVTIGPNDQVMLLGTSSVTIEVDGQPVVYRNVGQFLRTLHGSDIERIEIVTNPSAQYSSVGIGGIINFVLRRKQKDGLSGTLSAEARRVGFLQAIASLKYKKGKRTYEFQVQGASGRTSNLRNEERRSVQTDIVAAPTIYTDSSRDVSDLSSTSVSAKVTFALSDASNLSAQTIAGTWSTRSTSDAIFQGLTPDFASFREHQRSEEFASYVTENILFSHKGSEDGESLEASLRIFANPTVHGRSNVDTDAGAGFSTSRELSELYSEAKIDWAHPTGDDRILSTGGQLAIDDLHHVYRFTDEGAGAFLGFDDVDRFRAFTRTAAAYVTYQQALGRWKVMPGLRLEGYRQTVTSPQRLTTTVDQTNLFPTLHIERPIGKTLDLTLSYSKRIDRPDPDDLRPYPVVKSIDLIAIGNPDLRAQSTDAYEINLHYHRKKSDAGVIVYDRETSRLFSDRYSVDSNGLAVITPINAGHRSNRGAEIDITTPVAKRLKATASINLFNSNLPIDELGGTRRISTFRDTTNATLEWDGPERAKRPGDVVQLQWTYRSAWRDFQVRNASFNALTLSYTHSFSRSLSLTGTADWFSPIRYRVEAPLVREGRTQRQWTGVRVKLLKTIGKP